MGKMSIEEVAGNHTGAPGLPCLMSGCGAVDASAVVQALQTPRAPERAVAAMAGGGRGPGDPAWVPDKW